MIRLQKKQSILYVQTSGIDQPDGLYTPFLLASTAVAMGIGATIYFIIKGITVVKKGEAEKIQLGELHTLKQVMDQAISAGVKLMICEQSCILLNLKQDDFIEGAIIVGAATLNDLLLDADAVLSF